MFAVICSARKKRRLVDFFRNRLIALAVLFTLFSPVCVNAGYLGGVDAKALQDIIDDSTGRVVVLSFWATWCPPCVREMPDFMALRRSVPDDEMCLIGISLDFDEDSLKTYVDENKVNFPIYRSTPGLAKHFEVEGVPKLMVWDAQGTLRVDHVGYVPGDVLRALVMQFLPEHADGGPQSKEEMNPGS